MSVLPGCLHLAIPAYLLKIMPLGLDSSVGCGLSLVIALRGFLRVLQFPPLLKNQHFQIPIRTGECRQLVLCAKYKTEKNGTIKPYLIFKNMYLFQNGCDNSSARFLKALLSFLARTE